MSNFGSYTLIIQIKFLVQQKISQRGINTNLVDIRLVLKHALELNSTALVLCHNNPSGKLNPSEADFRLTEKVKLATKLMDIQVLDHIIIDHSYFSFADQGRI